MSRATVLLVATTLAGSAAGTGMALAEDAGVVFRDAVARVEVIPGARTDVAVSVVPGRKGLPQVRVYREGGRTIVDGGLAHRIRGCGNHGSDRIHPQAEVWGIGRIQETDMPVITVHTPRDSRIAADGAVFGRVGPAQSTDLAVAGCGEWSVGDVAGALAVHVSGSGDVVGRRAGSLRASVSGSGDVKLDTVDREVEIVTAGSSNFRLGTAGSADIRVSGSSDIRIGEIHGPVRSEISGSGDVIIDRGRATEVRVAVSGSGDFRFHGSAGAVSASVAGSGGVEIDHATGPVSQSKAGSGDIRIGH